jgi:hypothetical protein
MFPDGNELGSRSEMIRWTMLSSITGSLSLFRSVAFAATISPIGLLGCASTSPAKPPKLPAPTADIASRQEAYDKYRLTEDEGAWKRQDGRYEFAELKELAKQSPETEDVYDRAVARSTLIGSFAWAGGFVLGGTLGYNLTAGDNSMSTELQTGLYVAGGGLLVLALVTYALWRNPTDEFAATYNRKLRQRLDLSRTDGGVDSALRRPAWIPTALGPGGAQWRFSGL